MVDFDSCENTNLLIENDYTEERIGAAGSLSVESYYIDDDGDGFGYCAMSRHKELVF